MRSKDIDKYISLHEEIENRIDEIVSYAQSLKLIQRGGVSSFEVCSDKIEVNLYDSWSYGGYDNHYNSIPTRFLYDDYKPYYDELHQKKKDMEIVHQQKKAEIELDNKRQQLKKLKEELGDE